MVGSKRMNASFVEGLELTNTGCTTVRSGKTREVADEVRAMEQLARSGKRCWLWEKENGVFS